jgi:ribonuclease G
LDQHGVIIRSAAINDHVASQDIVDEVKLFLKKWSIMVNQSKLLSTSKCLYFQQTFEDLIKTWCRTYEVSTITLKDIALKSSLIEIGIDKSLINIVKTKGALFQEKGIDLDGFISTTEFQSPEGVSVTINELEAFTVIDVNSAKYKMTDSKRLEVFKVNDIASKIIFKYLMIQQVSGIVLIDFIDMTDVEQQSFISHLSVEGYNKGNAIYIEGFTRLGLLELTKKREMPSIKDLLSFDFQHKDLLYWTLYQLYLDLERLTVHTNTKQVTLELETPLYIYLMQNRPFDGLDLMIKYKHNQGHQKSYKIHTEKH